MSARLVIKRDGKRVPFQIDRIARAIRNALLAVGRDAPGAAEELATVASEHVARAPHDAVDLEEIQDACVMVLQESGHYEAASAFIRYRDARERARRDRIALGDRSQAPNLTIIDGHWRPQRWNAPWLIAHLKQHTQLGERAAVDVVAEISRLLAGTTVEQLSLHHLWSLADAAMVRLGLHDAGLRHAPLRVETAELAKALRMGTIHAAGRAAARQWSLGHTGLSSAAIRLWGQGRLWMSGTDDPARAAALTFTVENAANPWQVLTQAFAEVSALQSRWQELRIVLPPSILGHLERGAGMFVAPISALAKQAHVFLYCDGRTPLLSEWPFPGVAVGLASYNQDFILDQRLRELGSALLSGPYLLDPQRRQRVVVELALNAQGLDNLHGSLDELALAGVGAIAARLATLRALGGEWEGSLCHAVFGLPHDSTSRSYLEAQISLEGQRMGLSIDRVNTLNDEACAHFGRLLDEVSAGP